MHKLRNQGSHLDFISQQSLFCSAFVFKNAIVYVYLEISQQLTFCSKVFFCEWQTHIDSVKVKQFFILKQNISKLLSSKNIWLYGTYVGILNVS